MIWLGVTFDDNLWLGVLENKQEALVFRVEVSGGSTIVGLGKKRWRSVCFIMKRLPLSGSPPVRGSL